jgi:hypothetical protein
LILLASAPRGAALEPDYLEAVRHPVQQKVLRDNSLAKPPDLRRFGWTLDADGVYRSVSVPAGTARRAASAEQLAAALARWQSANGTAILNRADTVLPPTPDAAVLAEHERRRARAATALHDDGENLTPAQRFDAAFPANPAAIPPAAQDRMKTGLRLLGAQRLSEGAVDLSGNAKPSAWEGMSSGQIDKELMAMDVDSSLIEPRRAELIRLVSSGGGWQRGKAIMLLGSLHDEALLPVLLPALMRETDSNREHAAEALASIVANFKARQGGWSAFVEKAPPVLNVMFKSVTDWNYDGNVRVPLQTSFDLLNLMEPSDKKRFLAGFNDSRVLLMMMSLGDTTRIGREEGIHSDTAALMYARYKELSSQGGAGLGTFLTDPAMSQDTRAILLDRLNRYKFIGPELERDESLRRVLPALLFGPGSRVPASTVFSVSVLASGLPKAEFAKNSMAFIRGAPAKDTRAALAFFVLHPQMLTPDQRRELDAHLDGLDAHMREAMAQYRGTPSVYSYWPKTGPIDAALLMTQEGHAQLFMKTLTSRGYQAERGPGGAVRFRRGQVRISVYQFASNSDGWALDRPALGRAVSERLRDSKYQVVVYRGHVGDYGRNPMSESEKAKGKVFIDLGCDSNAESWIVMQHCDDCAFFGTNQTAEGVVNNAFLPEALEGLGARESFAAMERRFRAKVPKLVHRFTGSWSAAHLWEAAAQR